MINPQCINAMDKIVLQEKMLKVEDNKKFLGQKIEELYDKAQDVKLKKNEFELNVNAQDSHKDVLLKEFMKTHTKKTQANDMMIQKNLNDQEYGLQDRFGFFGLNIQVKYQKKETE